MEVKTFAIKPPFISTKKPPIFCEKCGLALTWQLVGKAKNYYDPETGHQKSRWSEKLGCRKWLHPRPTFCEYQESSAYIRHFELDTVTELVTETNNWSR